MCCDLHFGIPTLLGMPFDVRPQTLREVARTESKDGDICYMFWIDDLPILFVQRKAIRNTWMNLLYFYAWNWIETYKYKSNSWSCLVWNNASILGSNSFNGEDTESSQVDCVQQKEHMDQIFEVMGPTIRSPGYSTSHESRLPNRELTTEALKSLVSFCTIQVKVPWIKMAQTSAIKKEAVVEDGRWNILHLWSSLIHSDKVSSFYTSICPAFYLGHFLPCHLPISNGIDVPYRKVYRSRPDIEPPRGKLKHFIVD